MEQNGCFVAKSRNTFSISQVPWTQKYYFLFVIILIYNTKVICITLNRYIFDIELKNSKIGLYTVNLVIIFFARVVTKKPFSLSILVDYEGNYRLRQQQFSNSSCVERKRYYLLPSMTYYNTTLRLPTKTLRRTKYVIKLWVYVKNNSIKNLLIYRSNWHLLFL